MRAFTVDGTTLRKGLPVSYDPYKKDPYPVCEVGKKGRGQRFAFVPFGRPDFGGNERVDRCHPLYTREKNTLMLVKEIRRDERRAIILVKVRGGERGSAYIRTEDGHRVFDMEDEDRYNYGLRLLAQGHNYRPNSNGPDHEALMIFHEGACVQVERSGRIDYGMSKVWIRWLPTHGVLMGTLADVYPPTY